MWIRRLANPLLLVATVAMLLPFAPRRRIDQRCPLMGAARTVLGAAVGDHEARAGDLRRLAAGAPSERAGDIRCSLRPLLLLALIGAGVCLVQGDLGSAIVIAAIVLVIAFIGGVPFIRWRSPGSPQARWRWASWCRARGSTASPPFSTSPPTGLAVVPDVPGHAGDRRRRLHRLRRRGRQRQARLHPLAHSDFIFAVIADEPG